MATSVRVEMVARRATRNGRSEAMTAATPGTTSGLTRPYRGGAGRPDDRGDRPYGYSRTRSAGDGRGERSGRATDRPSSSGYRRPEGTGTIGVPIAVVRPSSDRGYSSRESYRDDRTDRRPDRSGRPGGDRGAYADRRPREGGDDPTRGPRPPFLPRDLDLSALPRGVRAELRGLSAERAERVGGHLLMAGQLIDDDPQLAHRHAVGGEAGGATAPDRSGSGGRDRLRGR